MVQPVSLTRVSPITDRAYCFYCYLFWNDGNPSNCSALVTSGYNKWKRVNDGSKCTFLMHLQSSDHNMCERRAKDVMKPSQHIDKVMHTVSNLEVEKRRLRLKTSIRSVRWLSFQSCSFRGHDESPVSLNSENFLEMIKILAETNTEIDQVVLKNAPKNAQYIAPSIQKEILHIMVNRVRMMIREEIGDEYFCILVDEAQDTSKREQMAIILRFVNRHGILMERYFDIKSVSHTTSSNLKTEILSVLAQHELEVAKMRGQGYDGATKEVDVIWEFFSHLDNIVNIITSSPKRITELHFAQRNEIEHMLATGECESRR
ncbi:zinc finger MYM-type protein 1-like [Olea europaea var. sylvestris]|uniref:zinc finger MYM-type protein 1-like n=1 Tax=Olea europaea var. sylvestris TaxID=158386 RepID=UPI000C1D1C3A|nr:zinc finger MYM-type protein 1-like [Olea europaea var. sylvestris]